MGGGQQFESQSDPKPPSLGVWLFLAHRSQHRLGIARTLNQDQKKALWSIEIQEKAGARQELGVAFEMDHATMHTRGHHP